MRKAGNMMKDIVWSKGFTIKSLADELGICASALDSKMTGYRSFKLREINFICDKLDMTYEELFRKNDKIKTS